MTNIKNSQCEYSPREVTQLVADETGQVVSIQTTLQEPATPELTRIEELEKALHVARYAIPVNLETEAILYMINDVLERSWKQ